MPLYLFADKLKWTILLLWMLSLTACSSYRYLYYVPNPNNPTFSKKGDSKISAEATTGYQHSTFSDRASIQAAYAVSNHWALGYSYDHREEANKYFRVYSSFFVPAQNNLFDSSNVMTKRNAHEFSVGYYTALNKENTLFFSTYFGYGLGYLSLNESGHDTATHLYERHLNASINKLFIQPSLYIKPIHNVTMAVVAKITALNFNFTDNNYTDYEKDYFNMNVSSRNLFLYVEPTGFISAGIKNVHFMVSWTLGGIVYGKRVDAISNCFAAGLELDLVNLLKNK